MLHGVWLKVLVPLLAVAYAVYRIALSVQIARARRAGDEARVQKLRTRGFGLYRWAVAFAILVMLFLLLLLLTS
jgi:hypothetical protein